jgi:transposase
MDRREITMYKLQDIIEDLLNNTPIKKIARTQRIARNTIRKYKRILIKILQDKPIISSDINLIMKEFRQIRKEERYSKNFGWLEKNKKMVELFASECNNYVRLIEVLQKKGFSGSYSSLLRYLSKNFSNSDKPIIRIETKAGEAAQVDFGYAGKIYDEEDKCLKKAYVFVMVLCYSRDAYYEIVKNQDVQTWCNCHIHAFEYFAGIPKIIIPDNLKSAIIKASFCDPVVNRSYSDLAKHYGFQIDPCIPATPQHKGKVESSVKYVKNNFMKLRSFTSFTDANLRLESWNKNKARERIHGTTRRKPKDLFELYEKKELIELPISRFEIPVYKELKVSRDFHIQLNKAYYSVPYELCARYVLARKTDSQVTIFKENKIIAVHSPQNQGKRSTSEHHMPPNKLKYMKHDTDYCLKKAGFIGDNTLTVVKNMLTEEVVRNLRGVQNIIRLEKKYGKTRLEKACSRAVFFNNYSYYGIKRILEQELDKQDYLFYEKTDKTLNSGYARNIKEILIEEVTNGNISTG